MENENLPVLKQVQDLMKLPQHHCKVRGDCCRVATFKGGLSYEEIKNLIGDPTADPSQKEGAKDFLSIFLPYQSTEEATQVAPLFVKRVQEHFSDKDSVSFFYCQYLKESQCSIHEDRPQLCRMYPIPHEKTIYHAGCGFEQIGTDHSKKITALLKDLEAQQHFQNGNVFYDNNEFETAIEHFTQAIGKKSDFESAYINLGIAHYKIGQVELAIDSLKKAIHIQKNSTSLMYLANILLEINHLDEAEYCFQETLVIEPNNAFAYLKLSRIASLRQNFDLMKQYMHRAYELNPELFKAL